VAVVAVAAHNSAPKLAVNIPTQAALIVLIFGSLIAFRMALIVYGGWHRSLRALRLAGGYSKTKADSTLVEPAFVLTNVHPLYFASGSGRSWK
jgi:hypothetical protein